MFKYVLLGSAIAIATPVVAQDAGMTTQTAPATTPMVDQAQPMPSTTPDTATTSVQSAPTAVQSAAVPAGATTATQPAAGDQVASIVDSEFGTYDKDTNGTLSKAEFASWMDTLKAKAPNAASQPADPKWNDAAFAQADTDKSTSVTKQELTGFLAGSARAGAM